MSKKPKVEVDLTNDIFESKVKEQQAQKLKRIEELARINQTNAKTILEARYTLKSMTQKLEIPFTYDEKELKYIPYDEVTFSSMGKLIIITRFSHRSSRSLRSA